MVRRRSAERPCISHDPGDDSQRRPVTGWRPEPGSRYRDDLDDDHAGPALDVGLVRRRRFPEGWWVEIELPLYARTELGPGRTVAEPAPLRCWVPMEVCTPIGGEDFSAVPTERPGRRPAWLLEERLDAACGLVAHRGDCAAATGRTTPASAEQVRRAREARGVVACAVCRPPAPG
ncbi:DUF6233 domain-containing protein [Streptomyces sp. B6B3]|uniref:DUF6233 domain-containing protein n=1 Tax=Streptomyces sp. B6B3 TaxID=3153570 RepID=UPI00325D07A1